MQIYTSKNTSVNTTKVPVIYKKINWEKIVKEWKGAEIHVWDMGCGRETAHIMEFLLQFGNIYYHGYDPYWYNGHNENHFDDVYRTIDSVNHCNIFICSNVLNIIYPWEHMLSFKKWFTQKGHMYFISVYEGDKSGEGKETKKDCWQWNKPLKDYVTIPTIEVVKKNVLTTGVALRYIK